MSSIAVFGGDNRKVTEDSIISDHKSPMILIVDDTRIDTEILANALSKDEYRVAVATDGRQALNIIGKVFPDLILLDIMMPEIDGFEVCKILKGAAETRDVPVIFLTVKDDTDDILRGYQAGAVDYVTKPFNSPELLARVRTHVALKQARDNEQQLISRLTSTLKERERFETELQKAHDNLERLVQERTAELLIKNRQLTEEIEERRRAEEALESKAKKIEEFNTALKVLLEQRDKDKDELDNWVLSNVKNLIMPNIEKLKKLIPTLKAASHISVLESNLKDITSSFSHRLSSKYLNLTAKEIQVANLVKDGKTSKDIAEILNISQRTIDFHRKNIRSKLGLADKRTNLRASLLNMI